MLVFALSVPLGAQALGLGEARVESFLNQPLDVRMRLLDVSDDDLDSLTVAPASPEDFQRLGLMSDSLALDLEIHVDRSISPPVVRVTSARPVSDPVVQLLVDARWARGRMLREYTLFLDPPTVEVEAPAPAVTEPEQQRQPPDAPDRAQTSPSRAAPSQPTDRSERQPSRPVAASGARRYGPVASGETLWSIARANLPAGDVTMNQMMIAIVELNPGAFRDRNINQLLRGAQLQLPDAEQVRQMDESAAAAEVAAQNRAFSRRSSSDVPVVSSAGREQEAPARDPAPADSAGPSTGRPESEDAVDHRLSLVPPGDEESGSGLSEDASEVADLRQRLARAEEELYAARQEAEEFQARVEDLETLVRSNPDGVGIRDAELAGLEATLRAAREATREDADPQLRSEVSGRLEEYLEQYEAAALDAGADEIAQGGPETGAAGDADPDAGIEAAQSGADEDAASADPEPRAVTEVQGSSGLLSNPMVLLVVGLIVVLLLLALVRFGLRRGRDRSETAPPLKRAADLPPTGPRAESPVDAARARVKASPSDLSAHLGLLQTLSRDGNEGAFGDALEAMFEHVESGSEPEWREALELAERIVPGHSLVKGSSDWVAESGRADDKPVSEVDEESEVDDLMSRLDADLEETDDIDWLDDDDAGKTEAQRSPLLRGDDYDAPPESDTDSGQATGASQETDSDRAEDEPIDFADWDDDESGSTEPRVDTASASSETTDEDEDDLVLDWPDEDRVAPPTDKAGDAPGAEQDESGFGEDAEESGDDIFAQSDDDIDVKLDLAKAYLSWNSIDSARTLLEEVVREGNDAQQEEARKLLEDLSDGSED